MAVSHCCVGQEQLLLRQHPVGNGLGAFGFKQVARALCRLCCQQGGRTRVFQIGRGLWAACCLWVAVDCDVGDVC